MTDPAYLTATRASYDTVAASYHELLQGEMATMPYDRAMLAAFAELVTGPVVDLGCGPGRITRHLASLGVKVFGVDLSPSMVEVAREKHPDLDFAVGTIPPPTATKTST